MSAPMNRAQANQYMMDMSNHSCASQASQFSVFSTAGSVRVRETEDGDLNLSNSGNSATNNKRNIRTDWHNMGRVAYGSCQAPGHKDQDRYHVNIGGEEDDEPHYFGVFDGHGTTALAADLCTEFLLHEIMAFNSAISSGVDPSALVPRTKTPNANDFGDGPFNDNDYSVHQTPNFEGSDIDYSVHNTEDDDSEYTETGDAEPEPTDDDADTEVATIDASDDEALHREVVTENAVLLTSVPSADNLVTIQEKEQLRLATNLANTKELFNSTVPCDDAIIAGFLSLDKRVSEHAHLYPRAGTTAVALFIGKEDVIASCNDENSNANNLQTPDRSSDSSSASEQQQAIAKVAWCGDSRCIMLDKDGVVTELTNDHKVHGNQAELDRINNTDHGPRPGLEDNEYLKGEVDRLGAGRVRLQSFVGKRTRNGIETGPNVVFAHTGGVSLQVSRSIGDFLGPRSVIATPEITTIRAPIHSYARFVLATDGIWDVITSAEAGKIVRNISDPKKAGKKLALTAKNRRKYLARSVDDITVIVVDVNTPTPEQSPVKDSAAGTKSRIRTSLKRVSAGKQKKSNSKCSIM